MEEMTELATSGPALMLSCHPAARSSGNQPAGFRDGPLQPAPIASNILNACTNRCDCC